MHSSISNIALVTLQYKTRHYWLYCTGVWRCIILNYFRLLVPPLNADGSPADANWNLRHSNYNLHQVTSMFYFFNTYCSKHILGSRHHMNFILYSTRRSGRLDYIHRHHMNFFLYTIRRSGRLDNIDRYYFSTSILTFTINSLRINCQWNRLYLAERNAAIIRLVSKTTQVLLD